MKTGKQLLIGLAFFLPVVVTNTSCKKESGNNPDQPQTVQPLPTPVGISTGPVVTRQIGAAGGSITSADQQITVTIPADALAANTTIGIEPITNTNIAGIGTAYRLTPHGQHFNKPVAITFSWANHADTIGLLQTMGLAYQTDNGTWKFVGAHSLDENAKTVTFETTHLSDWSLMNQVSLFPYHADIEPGQTETIAAFLYTSLKEDDFYFQIPMPPGSVTEPGYPVGQAIPLPTKFIRQWHLAGPGTLTSKAPSVVDYKAPASTTNNITAAVSLELKAPAGTTGQFLLVSNINVLGSFIELSIGGSTPVIFPASPAVKSGNQYLLANPNDEGGGYFLLTWTGGIDAHPFDLSNNGTYMHFITPQTSYVSRYRLNVNSDLLPSGGSVNVTKVSNGRAEGTFDATNAGYGPLLTTTTTLTGRFKVKLME